MANKTRCQTPGVYYKTDIRPRKITTAITLPIPLMLTKEDAALLETNLHNALELVMIPFYRKRLGG